METVGLRVGGEREGTGWRSLGGQGDRASGRHKVVCFFFNVCLWSVVCGGVGGWVGGPLNGSLGPLAKTPVGPTWQQHEAAWREESCI